MNKIFVGQFVSEKESMEDVRISQAGNNYQLRLIKMLHPELSISLFPIFLRKKSSSVFDRDKIIVNTQSLLPGFLHKIYKMISDTLEAFIIIKKYRRFNIFFYNIDKQNIFLMYLVKFLSNNQTLLILADYPYFNNKSFFEKTANYLIKKLNGVIVLNSNIILNKNQKTLPGLLQKESIIYKKVNGFKSNVLLSGSLGATTGLHIALETFAKKTEFNLYISGRPYNYSEEDFNVVIKSYTDKYENIKYLGLIPLESYQKVLSECDIALSLRNPEDIEHQYNFPSKILEYLSKSKLVISTLQYKDLPSSFLFNCEFNSESLSKCLDKIKQIDFDEINRLKHNIYKYLNDNFTEKKLNDVCNQLINDYDNKN